ncbi:ABC transporter ATP-binding protein [Minwuia thermotolerans]|uniref:ABC transporter n=1 Tax=Minwuia thermotolerans TaxID=2056226 RepID=A0A2M9G598_9PROT|nr:ABC transporter ATP-binding protein [Minwuia thermotolerans]PJK30881.1 ABC transporter [Minwuia thermotolerans]
MYELTDIEVRLGGAHILSVDGLSLATDRVTAILGHNGSGKSTLLSLLARQRGPTRGSILLDGTQLTSIGQRQFARQVAFLPQRLSEVPGLSVRELCGLGRFPWRGALGRWTDDDHAAVEEALKLTDLLHLRERLVDELSGGERQRAWIAMLLAQQSPVLLLDEPISALDLAHQVDILTLLRDLNGRAGRGVIVILHDINLAARFAHRLLVLKGGRIAFDGSPQKILDRETLSDLFGTRIVLVDHPGRELPLAVPA